MRKYVLIFGLTIASSVSWSATINIPDDHPTIQAGIDAASPGDTVLVTDGTYTGEGNRGIDFGGKNIVLKSENGPMATIIDCESIGRGINFHSGEDTIAVVDGFTIKGGYIFPGVGGGILCVNGSTPCIINCIIIDNNAGGSEYTNIGGGGMYCNSSPKIINCLFRNNSSGVSGMDFGIAGYGGGIAI